MAGFEFLFSFYGLLLGLAVANVTSGFADAWRRRHKWKMGAALPLLGLFILLAAAQQWASFWGARDVLTMGPWEILTSMGMALPYIFVSQGMFPLELEEGHSFERYYLQQSRLLLAVLLVPPAVSYAFNVASSPPPPRFTDYFLFFAAAYGPQVVPTVAMIIWRRPWVHRIGYALLCAWVLFKLFT
jgi:hypothetical protein